MSRLGKFYESMLTSGGIIRPQTVEAISARHLTGIRDDTFGYQLDRGLGIVVDSKHYCRAASWYGNRCSRRTWGHAGYYSSVGFLDPEHKVVVALVLNGMLESQEGRHDLRMISILDAAYEDLGGGCSHSSERHSPLWRTLRWANGFSYPLRY
jgi:CubicO group peptidase (beta-lactamase class C family)